MNEKFLCHTAEYLRQVGLFQSAWSAAELAIDVALRDFLRLTSEEAHLLVAGMEFTRKAALLRSLIARSDHEEKYRLIHAINTMQNASNRNLFTNSYVGSSATTVSYTAKKLSGSINVNKCTFTLEELQFHICEFCDASMEFISAMGHTNEEMDGFVTAVTNLNSRP